MPTNRPSSANGMARDYARNYKLLSDKGICIYAYTFIHTYVGTQHARTHARGVAGRKEANLNVKIHIHSRSGTGREKTYHIVINIMREEGRVQKCQSKRRNSILGSRVRRDKK